jgi:hypothetical protein
VQDNLKQGNKISEVYQQMREVKTPDESLVISILHGLNFKDGLLIVLYGAKELRMNKVGNSNKLRWIK